MKNLTHLLLFVGSFFISQFAAGQTQEVYSLHRNMAGDTLHIVKYNLTTQQFDTVFQLPAGAEFHSPLYGSSIDPYNRKYFFTLYNSVEQGGRMFGYDMNTQQMYPTSNSLDCTSQHYDQFLNSLIYKSRDTVKMYHLATNTIEIIAHVIDSNNCIASQPTAYNYLDGQLFYQTLYSNTGPLAGSLHWVVVDVSSKTVLSDVAVADSMMGLFLVFSPLTKTYFGVYLNALYELDPLHTTYTKVCDLPADNAGVLNEQNGMYDVVGNRYLYPYYTTTQENKLAVIDLNTDSITQILPFTGSPDLNQLLYTPVSANLILRNNKLWATTGEHYTWYFNNMVIADTTLNVISPTQTGYYKVGVHIKNTVLYSDSLLVNLTAISEPVADVLITIFPNPATNQLNISIDESLIGAQLYIYNVTGSLVQSAQMQIANSKFEIQNLPSGVYVAEVKTKEASVMRRWVKM